MLTIDYSKGIINTHEEIFTLGLNTGVIKLAAQTYSFGDKAVRGKANFANLVKDDPALAAAILEEVRKLDDKDSL